MALPNAGADRTTLPKALLNFRFTNKEVKYDFQKLINSRRNHVDRRIFKSYQSGDGFKTIIHAKESQIQRGVTLSKEKFASKEDVEAKWKEIDESWFNQPEASIFEDFKNKVEEAMVYQIPICRFVVIGLGPFHLKEEGVWLDSLRLLKMTIAIIKYWIIRLSNNYYNPEDLAPAIYIDSTHFTRLDSEFILEVLKKTFFDEVIELGKLVPIIDMVWSANNFVIAFESLNPIRQMIADRLISPHLDLQPDSADSKGEKGRCVWVDDGQIPQAVLCAPWSVDNPLRTRSDGFKMIDYPGDRYLDRVADWLEKYENVSVFMGVDWHESPFGQLALHLQQSQATQIDTSDGPTPTPSTGNTPAPNTSSAQVKRHTPKFR